MRAIFGTLSLLVVVAIVGVLARKQLSTAAPVVTAPAGVAAGAPVLSGSPQQQVQQFQQAVQESMQPGRTMPEEK